MSILDHFRRPKLREPCPICGHIGWCLIGKDGERVVCARVTSERKFGDAGWLHYLNKPMQSRRWMHRPRREKPCAPIDYEAMLQRWITPSQILLKFSGAMGVTTQSLRRLGAAWAGHAWAFPMREASSRIIGIRLRCEDGQKFAIKGSKSGLFIPRDLTHGPLVICEGPTDCAALLDLGFSVIGKPSCNSGDQLVCDYVARKKPSEIIIFSDHDGPGLRGAEALAARLWKPTRIVAPPRHKDARAWVNAGATRESVLAVIGAAEYVKRDKDSHSESSSPNVELDGLRATVSARL